MSALNFLNEPCERPGRYQLHTGEAKMAVRIIHRPAFGFRRPAETDQKKNHKYSCDVFHFILRKRSSKRAIGPGAMRVSTSSRSNQ